MSWSVPLFRPFGIPVRVHLLFFLVAGGLFLRQVVFTKDNPVWWVDVLLLWVLLPFGIVLLHEFGHCFGARAVDGEATGILIWPLGGLAHNDIPHTARALAVTVAAGPAVNVLICLACAAALAAGGFVPNLNPLANPYVARVHSFHDGRDYTSPYGLRLYKAGTAEAVPTVLDELEAKLKEAGRSGDVYTLKPEVAATLAQVSGPGVDRAVAPPWASWAQRAFWLSWVLFLFNLLPAYPLDGGQLLQAFIWARADYRRGVTVAAHSGLAVGVLFLVLAFGTNESLLVGLSMFMLYTAAMKLASLDAEDGPFGYDFSAGYTSLDKDEEPTRRVKRPGAVARWWAARKARKLQRELDRRQRDEDRKEHLLEKIAATGMGSLTDEERRFLQQFSSRYKNRS